ncbi:pentatricopeptide repeat-containing protein At3g29230 [Selaginella moellendorffii]|uniref:pentatricopeptide repeat-containing protein At3g29230 n=1 Tax=Selaginella moellendorffii TaxID=88036 RepID=UPI000D1C87B7|nr:pentatricopeptide repeat-containing protein At3g29230 [Selaginella moellendorffii]|eukprot:XP_024540998.1 pentatricopeptide repeat-containing protein At3g29230 [Selaginella moellendorffii]
MPNQKIMLQMYRENLNTEKVCELFGDMPQRNLASWTTILQANADSGNLCMATTTFWKMPGWSVISWTSMVCVLVSKRKLEEAKVYFERCPMRDLMCWNAAISALATAGYLDHAKALLEKIPASNNLSWTSMVIACGENGNVTQARDLIPWNASQETSVLNALIVTHAHNGHLFEAKEIFHQMHEKNTVSWNAMIVAYAQKGYIQTALELSFRMCVEGVNCEETTVTGILFAFSHEGMLQEALSWFRSMAFDHDFRPSVENFRCMIDILARMGRIHEAEELIHSMPFTPDDVSWGCLLSACRLQNDVECGARVASNIFYLQQDQKLLRASPYMLLASITN